MFAVADGGGAAQALLEHPREVDFDVADVAPGRVVDGRLTRFRRLGDAGQHRFEFQLAFRQLDHEVLLGPHLIGQCGELLGQGHGAGVGGDPAVLAPGEDALEVFEAFGGLLEERLHISRNRLFAVADGPGAGQAGEAR